MNTPRSWNVLTSNRLRDLPRPQQFATLALAYLESAQRLCDDLADSSDGATFERGAVVLYLSAHAIELFLKGAILRKAPNELFTHDLEHIHNRYKALFPAKRFALTNMPFTTEYPAVNSQVIAAIKREQPDPSELYRYPVTKKGEPWDGAFGFEAGSFSIDLATLHADFSRIAAEHEATLSRNIR